MPRTYTLVITIDGESNDACSARYILVNPNGSTCGTSGYPMEGRLHDVLHRIESFLEHNIKECEEESTHE